MASESHNEVGQSTASGSDRRTPARCPLDFPPGTHLVASRRGYLHHGIYVGDGRVIHYSGLAGAWRRGPVEEVSVEQFAAGRSLLIKPAVDARYGSAEIVQRARSRLGENHYRLSSNNCEHFCEWCICGEARSEQVDSLLDGRLLSMLRRLAGVGRREAASPIDQPAGGCAV